MADESGGGGSRKKYRGRKKRKTGVRKSQSSNMFSPQSGLGGLLGIGGNTSTGSIGDFLSNTLQGAADKINPKNNDLYGLLTGSNSKPMVKKNEYGSAVTGTPVPQQVAPAVTMRAKPASALDDGATGDTGPSIFDMIGELITQPGASFDYESAQREAANAIRQAYGAEISAIRQNNRVARKSSKHARKEIEHLYKGLARMYGKQEARADRRGQKSADRQMGIAEEGAGVLQDLNRQMIGEESQMLQDLGQQQAAEQLISPDYDRMGEQVGQITEQGTRAASQAERMGQNNARWFDRAQGGARLEGTNAQADMIGMLQEYLMNNRNQIAGLKGNRAQEVAASNMNIESQAAEAANQSNQDMIDNLLALAGKQAEVENIDQDNQREDAKFRWDKKMDRKDLRLKMLDAAEDGDTDSLKHYSPGIRDAMSVIAQTQDPNDKKATTALWKLFASEAWQNQEIPTEDNSGQNLPLTPYRAAALARKKGRALGLQGRELQEFVNAAAASV